MTDKLDRLSSMSRKATRDRVPRDPDARESQFRRAWDRILEHPGAARHLGTEVPSHGVQEARAGRLTYGNGLLTAESFWAVLKGGE